MAGTSLACSDVLVFNESWLRGVRAIVGFDTPSQYVEQVDDWRFGDTQDAFGDDGPANDAWYDNRRDFLIQDASRQEIGLGRRGRGSSRNACP